MVESAIPDCKQDLKIELASFTTYYTKTNTPIFKLDKGNLAPIFNESTVAAMGSTVARILEQTS